MSSVEHYENFPVASVLMPKRLRKPVAAIYHFARAADDIADEGDLTDDERLKQLHEFHAELKRIEANGHGKCAKTCHDHFPHLNPLPQAGEEANESLREFHVNDAPLTPLFRNLAAEIDEHALPMRPLYDLLDAFSQDVVKKRYANFDELQDYCRRSANPVGNLLLHLYGEATPVNLAYSDAICTSLQLVNFWQDVAKDWAINRVYLPQDDLAKYNVSEAQIAAGQVDGNWHALMQFEVDRAREMMLYGKPLGTILTGRIGLEMRMIIAGGLRILDKLEAADYDMFHKRPVLRPFDWVIMLAKSAPL
ncbi:MAG: squalene synthase HpnC [Gallionellales bacterium GWA2_59_43]|nr:MAG: squalene synthase HpnC [Gallionellales bacterium GWA2_59_43]